MPAAGVQSSTPAAREPAHVPWGKCPAPSAPAWGGHGAGSWEGKGGQADVDQGRLLFNGTCSGLSPNRGHITPCQAPGSLFIAPSLLGPKQCEQTSAQALQSSPRTLRPPSQRGLQPTGTPWAQPTSQSARIYLPVFTSLPAASLVSASQTTHFSSAQSFSSSTCPPSRAVPRLWAVLSQSCPSSPSRAQSGLQAHVGACWWVLEQFQVLQN